MYQPLAEGGDKNYTSYLQKQTRYYDQGLNSEQKGRSSEWKRGGSRILIDNPQLSGPRILVGKGWIFMSF